MQISRLTLYKIAVPLKRVVRHASFSRTESENLIAKVTLADGTTGYGEGVPRSYVTGETIESTFTDLESDDWARVIGRPSNFFKVVERLESLTLPRIESDPRGMTGNAARCALELAILDAYGRHFGESLGRAVDLANIDGLQRFPKVRGVRYSGAITAESDRAERWSAWKMRIYGFNQVKIKVGTQGQDDRARLARFRRILGSRMDIRLDANEAWHADDLLERVEPLRQFAPSALEQPVPHAEVDSLAELRPRLGIPVMLDESLCGYPDAVAAVEQQDCRYLECAALEVRRYLAVASDHRTGQRSGLGVQLGCHPGETSLLSAAGRHVAGRVAGLRYVEGSYDRHILKANLTTRGHHVRIWWPGSPT